MPPRTTRRSRSRLAERVEDESIDNTPDEAKEDIEIDIEALMNQAAQRLTELTAEDQATSTIDTSAMTTMDKSIAKTLGLDGKSSSVYNPTTRFLVPQVNGMIRLDQSQLNQTAATSTSVFLRAGVLSSTAADPIEKIDQETDLVAELVAEKDAAWKKKSEPPKKETAGKGWFDLPASELTEEAKNDFRLLRNRNALYKDRFYKREKGNMFPKYFQVGTVVEGATDVLSTGRINKRDRKNTIVEEVLADRETTGYLRKKFMEVQAAAPKKRTFTGKYATNKKQRK